MDYCLISKNRFLCVYSDHGFSFPSFSKITLLPHLQPLYPFSTLQKSTNQAAATTKQDKHTVLIDTFIILYN